jgi:hypothetical protein
MTPEEWVLTYTREDLHPEDLYTFEDMEEAYKAGQKNPPYRFENVNKAWESEEAKVFAGYICGFRAAREMKPNGVKDE